MKRNQFGGVVSGPVYLPKLLDGRNKIWFVFAYQGLRTRQRQALTGLVPTASERQGLFSTAIRDPFTGLPFPNNQIPASRINPVAAKLLPLWPDPNVTSATFNYQSPNSVIALVTDQYIAKVDFSESDRSRWSARFIHDSTPVINSNVFQAFAYNDPLRTWSQNLTNTRTLSPHAVNDFGVHYFMRPYTQPPAARPGSRISDLPWGSRIGRAQQSISMVFRRLRCRDTSPPSGADPRAAM